MRILLIDNEEQSRSSLKLILDHEGYEAFIAGDAGKGLETFCAVLPDIVLLDVKLPGTDGIEVLKKIQQGEHAERSEIIMLSGSDDISAAISAIKCGAFSFLRKPVEKNELLIEIKRAFEKLDLKKKLSEYVQQLEERSRQMEHMASVGMLAAGVAHEINNPAMFIAVNLQNLMQHMPEIMASLEHARSRGAGADVESALEDMPKICDGIKKGGERIKKIVETLKKYSSRKSTDRDTQVSLEECIDLAFELCQNRLKYNVEIKRSRMDASAQIACNPQQIEQVLVNLLVNAVDALEGHGKGVIEIITEKDGGIARLTIADNGPGFPEAILKNLFKPFFTTKEIGKGTGLGLSICQRIIMEHGGTILASNRPQGGAAFIIELPLFNEGNR